MKRLKIKTMVQILIN